jgi:MSHA biogenesis protein MshJ
MNPHWENIEKKVNGLSLRERAVVFVAAAVALVWLTNILFIDPLLAEQKKVSVKVQQQQEKLKEIQAQLDASSQARMAVANSPLRQRIEQVKQQVEDGGAYLRSLQERMVAPEKMAELLEQVLKQHGRLQLVDLKTLPATPLIDKEAAKPGGIVTAPASEVAGEIASAVAAQENQAFKHGVIISVRGSYLDLLQYLTDLEHMPTQMFWGNVEMKAEHYPDVVLTLTVYTLSLDKTWLKI